MKRLVTHYLRTLQDEPVVGEAVIFKLLKVGRENNSFYLKNQIVVTSDETGLVAVELWVNATGDSEACYRVHLPDCSSFDFTIPVGTEPITLSALKEGGVSWEDPRFLSTIEYLKQNSKEFDLDVIAEKSYVHIQSGVSNVWDIEHNLDKYPSITVLDENNAVIEGVPEYIDSNNLRITFNPAIKGTAHLN